MIAFYVFIILVALLVLWVIGKYNGLVDRSSNDEYTKDESTKPEIRLIPNVVRSCRRLPSPEPATF